MIQTGQSSPTLLAHDRVGKVVDGRYRIDEMLRDGAMGTVYRATQLSIDRTVALKVVDRRQITGEGNIQRFMSEARIISEMTHPNIVRLFDFGQDDSMDLLFLVMEFIEGPSLELLLEQKGRLKQDFAIEMIYQACGALTDPHANGVIHRDLKPENMLLLPMSDGSVQLKVVDFGVARVLSTDKRVTAKGIICGTPWYMAPEQAEQQGEVDARADLYALGVIFYQMLCGCPPFDAEGAIQVILKQIRDRPTPLSDFMSEEELAPGVEKLIMKMLSKRAKRRPANALDLRRDIEDLLDEHRFQRIRVETTGDMLERFDRWSLPVIEEARQALVFNPGPPRAIAEEPVDDTIDELVNPVYGEDEESEPVSDEDAAKLDEVKASAADEAEASDAANAEEFSESNKETEQAEEKLSEDTAEDLEENSNSTDKHGAFLAQANEKPSSSEPSKPNLNLKGLPKTSDKTKGPPPPRVELFSGGTINAGRAFIAEDATEALAKAPPLEPYKPAAEDTEQSRDGQTGTMTFSPPSVAMNSDSSNEIRKVIKTPQPLDPSNKKEVEDATASADDDDPGEQRGTERFSAMSAQTRKSARDLEPLSHIGGKRVKSTSTEEEPSEEEDEQEDIPRLSTEEVKAKRSDAAFGRVDVADISEEIKRREAAIAAGPPSEPEDPLDPMPLYSDDGYEQQSNTMTYAAIAIIALLVFGGLAVLYNSKQKKKAAEASNNEVVAEDKSGETNNASANTDQNKTNSVAAVGEDKVTATSTNNDKVAQPEETTPSVTSPETTETTPPAEQPKETTPVEKDPTPPSDKSDKQGGSSGKTTKTTDRPKGTKSPAKGNETTSSGGEDKSEGSDEKPVDDKLQKNLEWLRER